MESNHYRIQHGVPYQCKGEIVLKPEEFSVRIQCSKCLLNVQGRDYKEAKEKWEELNRGKLR